MTNAPRLPKIVERPADQRNPLQQAMYDIADALEYPIDKNGYRYDLRYLTPLFAWHLPRAGIGRVEGLAVIKKRILPSGLIDWVPVGWADTIEDELAGATLADVDDLSPAARAEFIRRAGGAAPTPPAPEDLDAAVPWHVQTSIHFDDDEEIP